MKMLAVALLLITASAVAECPFSVPCPYDGEQMQNTWNCKGIGAQRACEFAHSKYVDGKEVRHRIWAACADREQ